MGIGKVINLRELRNLPVGARVGVYLEGERKKYFEGVVERIGPEAYEFLTLEDGRDIGSVCVRDFELRFDGKCNVTVPENTGFRIRYGSDSFTYSSKMHLLDFLDVKNIEERVSA